MPGIAGQAGTTTDTALLGPMLDRMTHHPWYVRHCWADPGGAAALGRVSLGFVNTAPQPARLPDGPKWAVLEGEVYDYAARRRTLEGRGRRFLGESHAELLLHGLEADGPAFVRSLGGCFAAAVWDPAAGTLRLVNDRFGMRPLYYAHLPGRIVFGSEVKALLADPALPRGPDPGGLAQFFVFGHYLGETTSLAAVRLLPAAGVLTYSAAEDRVELARYARLGETWVPSAAGTAELLDRIDAAFVRSVERCTAGTASLGLSLSGGLDARTILAVAPPDRPLTTLTLGMEGSIDVRAAAELSRLANRPHHTHTLDARFLARFEHHMRTMVHLTDGQYLSQCIGTPTLPDYRRLGVEVLLRGHAGELMHMTKAYRFSLDAAALSVTDATVEDWLWSRLQAHMLGGVSRGLFAPGFGADPAAAARESLHACLKESDGVAPPLHRVWHVFLGQRVRRETGLSMVELGSVVETRLPYLDAALVDALMAAPPEIKLGETVQAYILGKRRPSFLGVVNSNTGARVGAGRMARRLATLWKRVLAKLGVRGYQPYERLGQWLRRELRPLVERILLDDRCLGRGVLNPDTVRSVVASHLAHRHNHTFLLLGMMVFELGQREFVDGEACPADGAPASPRIP